MTTKMPPQEILLVPGLFEPRFALWPLQRALQSHCGRVESWRDRLAFRELNESVNRMARRIAGDAERDGAIGIVTHSFGDWVARAAIVNQSNHRVRTLVSLAPVMKAGFLARAAYALSGKLIPEVAVTMDSDRAAANLDCDPQIRRMVVWSKFDESLQSIDLTHLENVQTRKVVATHLTIALQPNVHRLVGEFMFGE
ncbi:hypothetical protein NZK35_14755 [Stieleria sp. ICT_E10.1]|uniref:esterase/lipase family protein n=1 Tax=Stieleria sedimenti TaxID=2976331 RepID=UPI00217F7920|nr:hypothetical protein [Stieleria sedimenti]MCS7467911.1 hypothetical protein [Stieleria sedimenti]